MSKPHCQKEARIALAMSIIFPGVGHFINRMYVRAFMYSTATFALLVLSLLLGFVFSGTGRTGLLLFVLVFPLWGICLVEVYFSTKKNCANRTKN